MVQLSPLKPEFVAYERCFPAESITYDRDNDVIYVECALCSPVEPVRWDPVSSGKWARDHVKQHFPLLPNGED